MICNFGFAKTKQILELDKANVLAELRPNKVEISATGVAEVKRSLEQPISSPRLQDLVKPGEKVAIITSDITRPMPSKTVLPLVLEELYLAGISDGDIAVVLV